MRIRTSLLSIGLASSLVVATAAALILPEAAGAQAVSPGFRLAFADDVQTVAAGGTATYAGILRPSRGFRGAVFLSLPNLSPALTPRITSSQVNRFILQISVPATVPAHTGVFVLRGQSGGVTSDVLFRLTVTAPPGGTTAPPPPPPSGAAFALRADNPEVTVAASQTAAFGVTVDRSGGYAGSVRLSASGLPAGVASNFAPNPTTASTVFYATPSAATPDGRYTVSVTATSADGSVTRTTSFVLGVQNRPDFVLTVPASATVEAGGPSVFVQIPYRALGASAPTVSLAVSTLPSGLSVSFTPNPTFGQATLDLNASAATTPGSYPVTITASSGAIVHQYPLTIVVSRRQGDFALNVPPSFGVASGGTTFIVIGYQPLGGTPSVGLNIAGLPNGMTASFTPNPTFGQTTLVVTTQASVAAGSYQAVVTGIAGGIVHQYPITLVVGGVVGGAVGITLPGFAGSVSVTAVPGQTGTPGYGLSATPGALTIARGSSGSVSVTVTPTGGFGGPVQVSLSGVPVGTTGTVTTSGNVATFTLAVPAATAPGVYPVTISGTTGSLSASVVVSLTIT